MYICKNVLTKEEVATVRKILKESEWNKGHTNADETHKKNEELVLQELSEDIAKRIYAHETVQRYGLFKQLMIPRFNKYNKSGHYARHVDFFKQKGLRTDWSMTLFLTEPNTYKGGELLIEGVADKTLSYKLPAGDMILYPSGYIHNVTPVTKGTRLAVISWAESEVEDLRERQLIGQVMDVMVELDANREEHMDKIVKLSSVHNGLLRKWSK